MINLIPFLMVPVAFWMHRDHSSNLAAIGAFIILYSLMLFPHYLLEATEFIFILNILSAATLSTVIKRTCKTPSLLIVLILLTCFALTILNGMAFLAYNYYEDGIYQASLYVINIFVGLQWAALWIRDDGIVNGSRLHNNISRHILDRAGILLDRAKIH
jgi:hypothetical protein